MFHFTQDTKINLKESVKVAVIALVITLGVTYAYAAWTGPTATPPNNNTNAPINVGAVDQIKNAGLGVNSLAVFGNGVFSEYMKVGTTTATCNTSINGALRFDTNSGSNCLQLCIDPNWKDVVCPQYKWVYVGQESKLTHLGSCYQNIHHTITCGSTWDGNYLYGDRDSPPGYGEITGTAGPGIKVYVSTYTPWSYPYRDYVGIQGPNYGVTAPYYGLSKGEPNVISGGYDSALSTDSKVLEVWKGDTCGSDTIQFTTVDVYECQKVIN